MVPPFHVIVTYNGGVKLVRCNLNMLSKFILYNTLWDFILLDSEQFKGTSSLLRYITLPPVCGKLLLLTVPFYTEITI